MERKHSKHFGRGHSPFPRQGSAPPLPSAAAPSARHFQQRQLPELCRDRVLEHSWLVLRLLRRFLRRCLRLVERGHRNPRLAQHSKSFKPKPLPPPVPLSAGHGCLASFEAGTGVTWQRGFRTGAHPCRHGAVSARRCSAEAMPRGRAAHDASVETGPPNAGCGVTLQVRACSLAADLSPSHAICLALCVVPPNGGARPLGA